MDLPVEKIEAGNIPDLVDLEKVMLQFPQPEIPIEHHFADHIYVRKMIAPADSLIVGKRHRYATATILLEGEMSVYNEHTVERYKAPAIWNSIAGGKRLLYSHTDTVLVTVHPTTETDPDKIEEIFIVPESEYENGIIMAGRLAELGGGES